MITVTQIMSKGTTTSNCDKEELYGLTTLKHDEKVKIQFNNDTTNDIIKHNCNFNDLTFTIRKVIFSNPATIVIWEDGTKTVVKVQNEIYDPEKGLAMCYVKKLLGNKGNYYKKIKEWLPECEEGK